MTSTAISAQGTVIQIGTGTGASKAISGVAAGNPTIITATSHGFANGDVVTIAGLTGADAALLNGKTFVVTNKTTNTFALAGSNALDTTGKTITFSGSPTATGVTYTAIGNVRSFSNDGGSVTTIDVTNFDSAAKEYRAGLIDYGSISFEVQVDNGDAGQLAVEAARLGATMEDFKVILPSGTYPTATFSAFVTKFSRSGSVDAVVTGSVDMKITGPVVWS